MSELTTRTLATGGQPLHTGRQLRTTLELLGWLVVMGLLALGLNSVFARAWFVMDSLNAAAADPMSAYGPFDGRYAEHYLVTIGHLIPALLIVVTGPLQFIRRIRKSYPRLHRWCGRVFLVAGAVGACTGFVIGGLYPFMGLNGAGFNEAMATVAITGYTLVCLARAYVTARRRQFAVHREWVIRAFSIMLGIATERIMLGTLMATTDISVSTLFGATFWMAGVVHVLAAEYWIRVTRTVGSGVAHWKDLDARV